MARRQFRPLTLTTGSPTTESMFRRSATRRTFRQLTGAVDDPPPPLPGKISRTFVPAVIADYESVSTASWTNRVCTTATGTYNCFTYHLTTPNQKTTSASVIMDPIRWSVHEPAANGDTYDSCGQQDPFSVFDSNFTGKRGHRHYATVSATNLQKYLTSPFVDGLGMINTMLPVSGNGHVEFQTAGTGGISAQISTPGTMRGIAPWVMDGQYRNWNSTTAVVVPELHAISSTTQWARNRFIKARYGRHRVNGVAVGSFSEWPFTGSPDPKLVTLSAGDTYEFDIWYELSIEAWGTNPQPGKHAVWIVDDKVSNGSRLMPAGEASGPDSGDRRPRFVDFTGCNFNPNFDETESTYELTLAGASHTWAFPNGTQTQKVANLPSYGWSATVNRKSFLWTGPASTSGGPATIRLYIAWDVESVNLRLTVTRGTTTLIDTYYRPEDSGDYVQTTISSDFGNVSWAPRGVFNGDGTTVFERCGTILSDGRLTPGAIPFGGEAPDTITLEMVAI